MTPEHFYQLFESFHVAATRLETLPEYAVADYEGDRLAAFIAGRPLPPRTVLTDPWLANIARTALAGKTWSRLRIVDTPPTTYQRFELEVFKESQAVGEQIRVARRGEVQDAGPDVWVFDADTPAARAVVMAYDARGEWLGAELVDDPLEVAQFSVRLRRAEEVSVPLNEFLVVAGG